MLVFWLLLISLSPPLPAQQLQRKSEESCPAPIGQFIEFPNRVVTPKIPGQLIAILTVKENTYYGSSACSILEDARDSVFDNFGVEEHYRGPSRRTKDCVVRLTSSNFAQDLVDLTILLIVQLVPGLPTRCDSPISAKATIRVEFCRPETTGCSAADSANPSDRRVLDRSGRLSVTDGVTATERSSLVKVERTTKQPVSDLFTKAFIDENASLILAIGLLVTLVGLSLVLGLIYFWCPSLCCCFNKCGQNEVEVDTVKILTVRDESGRVIKNARTVEVWKTKDKRFKTYDILETKCEAEKQPEQNRQSEEKDHIGGYTDDFNTTKIENKPKKMPIEQDVGRVIVLRSRLTPNGRNTVFEELNPSRLSNQSPYHEYQPKRYFRILEKDNIDQIENSERYDPYKLHANYGKHTKYDLISDYVSRYQQQNQFVNNYHQNPYNHQNRYVKDLDPYQDAYDYNNRDQKHYGQEFRSHSQFEHTDLDMMYRHLPQKKMSFEEFRAIGGEVSRSDSLSYSRHYASDDNEYWGRDLRGPKGRDAKWRQDVQITKENGLVTDRGRERNLSEKEIEPRYGNDVYSKQNEVKKDVRVGEKREGHNGIVPIKRKCNHHHPTVENGKHNRHEHKRIRNDLVHDQNYEHVHNQLTEFYEKAPQRKIPKNHPSAKIIYSPSDYKQQTESVYNGESQKIAEAKKHLDEPSEGIGDRTEHINNPFKEVYETSTKLDGDKNQHDAKIINSSGEYGQVAKNDKSNKSARDRKYWEKPSEDIDDIISESSAKIVDSANEYGQETENEESNKSAVGSSHLEKTSEDFEVINDRRDSNDSIESSINNETPLELETMDGSLTSAKSASVDVNYSVGTDKEELDSVLQHNSKSPLLAELKKRAAEFEDNNRTPSPAADLATALMEEARRRREH